MLSGKFCVHTYTVVVYCKVEISPLVVASSLGIRDGRARAANAESVDVTGNEAYLDLQTLAQFNASPAQQIATCGLRGLICGSSDPG